MNTTVIALDQVTKEYRRGNNVLRAVDGVSLTGGWALTRPGMVEASLPLRSQAGARRPSAAGSADAPQPPLTAAVSNRYP